MVDTTNDFHDKIRAALAQLDPADNEHWTDDGLPKTGVVQKLANDQTIKRSDIQTAAPGFERPASPEKATDDFGAPIDQTASTETGLAPAADGGTTLESADNGQGEYLTEEEVHSILAQRVAACENAIAAADKKAAEGQNERIAAVKALNDARKEMNAKFPPMTDAEMRKQYIASENARRQAQVEGRGVLASRIDQSMARGNSRGWRRPTRGVMGSDGTLMKTPDGQVAMPQPMRVRPQALRSVAPTAQRA